MTGTLGSFRALTGTLGSKFGNDGYPGVENLRAWGEICRESTVSLLLLLLLLLLMPPFLEVPVRTGRQS